MKTSLSLSWRISILPITLSVAYASAAGSACIVHIVDGKIEKHGNCQHPERNSILADIKARATAEKLESASSSYTVKDMDGSGVTQTTQTSGSSSVSMIVWDGCRFSEAGDCFWTYDRGINTLSYYDADETCKNYSSVLAAIPDERTYNAIVDDVISKIVSVALLWTNMTYKSTTKEVYPNNSFIGKWYQGSPLTKGYTADTVILMGINATGPTPDVVSLNIPPYISLLRDEFATRVTNYATGAVCRKPKT